MGKKFLCQRKYSTKESNYIRHEEVRLHKKLFHKTTYITGTRHRLLQHSKPQLVVAISLLAPALSAQVVITLWDATSYKLCTVLPDGVT